MLVAFAPYQVDETVLEASRRDHPADSALLAATAWAGFAAARRIAGWLAPTAAA